MKHLVVNINISTFDIYKNSASVLFCTLDKSH